MVPRTPRPSPFEPDLVAVEGEDKWTRWSVVTTAVRWEHLVPAARRALRSYMRSMAVDVGIVVSPQTVVILPGRSSSRRPAAVPTDDFLGPELVPRAWNRQAVLDAVMTLLDAMASGSVPARMSGQTRLVVERLLIPSVVGTTTRMLHGRDPWPMGARTAGCLRSVEARFARMAAAARKTDLYWLARAGLDLGEALSGAMLDAGVDCRGLARRMKAEPSIVRRMIEGSPHIELAAMARAARALGQRIDVQFVRIEDGPGGSSDDGAPLAHRPTYRETALGRTIPADDVGAYDTDAVLALLHRMANCMPENCEIPPTTELEISSSLAMTPGRARKACLGLVRSGLATAVFVVGAVAEGLTLYCYRLADWIAGRTMPE